MCERLRAARVLLETLHPKSETLSPTAPKEPFTLSDTDWAKAPYDSTAEDNGNIFEAVLGPALDPQTGGLGFN